MRYFIVAILLMLAVSCTKIETTTTGCSNLVLGSYIPSSIAYGSALQITVVDEFSYYDSLELTGPNGFAQKYPADYGSSATINFIAIGNLQSGQYTLSPNPFQLYHLQ